MKNKLSDLNDHLFLALERLNDESITDDSLDKEISRSKAIVDVAGSIIANANVQLQAYKYINDNVCGQLPPALLLGSKNEQN